MTEGLRRGLVPILLVLIALVLSMHQVRAAEHAPGTCIPIVVHGEVEGGHEATHAMHSVGCCSLAIGLVASGFEAVPYGPPRTAFPIRVSDTITHPGFSSGQFRPPRLA